MVAATPSVHKDTNSAPVLFGCARDSDPLSCLPPSETQVTLRTNRFPPFSPQPEGDPPCAYHSPRFSPSALRVPPSRKSRQHLLNNPPLPSPKQNPRPPLAPKAAARSAKPTSASSNGLKSTTFPSTTSPAPAWAASSAASIPPASPPTNSRKSSAPQIGLCCSVAAPPTKIYPSAARKTHAPSPIPCKSA